MGVVSSTQLKHFMSDPQWSPAQTETAAIVLESLESTLADALGATLISPEPRTEQAPIIARSGQIATRYPVNRATLIEGTEVVEGGPLPAGWRLEGHRLWAPIARFAQPTVTLSNWAWSRPAPAGPTGPYAGTAEISYLAGWGTHPTLVLAILRKAQGMMSNRHSDAVTVRGLTASAPPKTVPDQPWTDDELKPLGRFRRFGRIGGG